MNSVFLIPAYNPNGTLIDIVSSLVELGANYIVVVDDGSKTECRPLFDKIGAIEQCHVLRHARNLGKGSALKTGLNYALVTWPSIETVVTADADGQHAPRDIVRVAEAALSNVGALVLGARKFHKEVPLRSLIGNSLTRSVFRVFTGLNLRDTQTGLRALPRPLCLEFLKINLNGYDFEMESIIRAKDVLGRGLNIVEVPIETIYEEGNKSSHFNPILDSMRIYFVFFRYSAAALINALVDNLVFIMAFSRTDNVGVSQIMGRFIATLIAFVLARNVVFHSSKKWIVSLMKFVFLVTVTGAVSYGAIDFLHSKFGINVIHAKLLTEGLLFLGNFAIQREFIFSK